MYDLKQIRVHYRKVIEDKTGDYDERLDPYILDNRPMVKELVAKTFQENFPQKVPVLLDVGCGTCFYFPLLSQHAEKLLGVDLCIPMLDVAEDLIKEKRTAVGFLKLADPTRAGAGECPFFVPK